MRLATRKWQRTNVREASRPRAAGSPVPGECREARTARPTEDSCGRYPDQSLKERGR
jgi:hypothetical protein